MQDFESYKQITPEMLVYALIFLMVFIYAFMYLVCSCIAYFHITKRNDSNMSPRKEKKVHLFVLLVAGLLLRIIIAPLVEGFSTDIECFKAWAAVAAEHFTAFYEQGIFCDYPPLYIYILFIIGKAVGAFNLAVLPWIHTLTIKLPSILTDIISGYFLFRLSRRHCSLQMSLFIAAAYVFNPAVILNSTLWGQVDSFFTMIVMLGVYLTAERKIYFASAVMTAAVLMKPQGIIFLPVLFFELARRKRLKDVLLSFLCACCSFIIIVLPFSLNNNPLWIFNLFFKTASEYPFASVNAFNLFSLLGGNMKQDSSVLFILSFREWGMIISFLVVVVVGFLYIKNGDVKTTPLVSILISTGVYMFSVRMHERYLFPVMAIALMAFAYLMDRRFIRLYALLSGTIFINTFMVLLTMLVSGDPYIPRYNLVLITVSFANVAIFGYLVKLSTDIFIGNKIMPLMRDRKKLAG